MSADQIVNTKLAFWYIIQDNVVVDDLDAIQANAVPNVNDWDTLTDAQWPNVRRFRYRRDHEFPVDDHHPVEFTIDLKWMYGARYKGGGAFIQSAWVEVERHHLRHPWNVNLRAGAFDPSNGGTATAPLAILPFVITGEVTIGSTTDHVRWDVVLYGDGKDVHS
jgi:hypothetical protein